MAFFYSFCSLHFQKAPLGDPLNVSLIVLKVKSFSLIKRWPDTPACSVSVKAPRSPAEGLSETAQLVARSAESH